MSETRPPRPSAGEGTTPAGFLTEYDLYLFREGTLHQLFDRLGAHPAVLDLVKGTRFAVWAPNARRVSVIGDFNGWRSGQNDLASKGDSGLWEGFVPGIGHGTLYKYVIESQMGGQRFEKADPIGFATELRPRTASKVWDLGGYAWGDAEWMGRRGLAQGMDRPISVYEVHLGSWRRVPEEADRWLTYQEAATQLAAYVKDMGYTHVELMPITEHPFDGSWGYQTLGFFAPTSRFGTPHDFMAFVDTLHRAGIGVILDWVPAHFPSDAHGLAQFDGTHLYEHSDPKLGRHPDWGSLIFNYGRTEVQNFLIASALFWIDRYHIDGLRIDAVASMLYLDYSRKEGEWIPNAFGGRENLAAIAFLKRLNETVYGMHPDTLTIAEESTSWPAVSRPTYVGGLGFGYKWDMGWMHDTLRYMGCDPVHRRFHHNDLTFRMLYAWHENFMLPLSHDEVVHGKSSLLGRMPGDLWQKFANLRLLHANQYGQPGKKLMFMGGEIAQWDEWQFARSLPWHLLQWEPHQGVQRLVRDLNKMYRDEPALHERESDANAFAWIDCSDTDASIVSFVRYARDGSALLWVYNYTPVPREGYRLGVPSPGRWQELLNTDSTYYGGTGMGNQGGRESEPIATHGHAQSVVLTLPPLAAVVLKG